MASKYNLEFGTKIVEWLMKQGPGWSEENLHAIRSGEGDFFSRGFRGRIKLHNIENRNIPGRHGDIPVRIYQASDKQNATLIVFYHGGGFTIGGLEMYDHICRKVAQDSDAVVVSVDYRLAPEHKYPIPVEDCYDALLWCSDNAESLNANPEKLFVMGDSAGGNLSAVATLLARDNGAVPIAGQVLIYPAVDAVNEERPSRLEFKDAPILPEEAMEFFIDMYCDEEERRKEPTLSPLLAEHHRELPPALILVAEYDPLRDEGIAYAEKLRADGVHAEDICYPRMVHGFISVGGFTPGAKRAYADIQRFIKQQT